MNKERLVRIIQGRHVSEKSHRLFEKHGQYVFKVVRDAKKNEIREAVEKLLGAKVSRVQTDIRKGKQKTAKGKIGKRSDWKRAIVTLQEGQEIKIAGIEG